MAPPAEPMAKPVNEPLARPTTTVDAGPIPMGQRAAEATPIPLGPRAAPTPIPDIARMTIDPKAPPKATRPEAKQGTKAVYDSLEQEMASLLGRPSGKS